MAVLNIYHLPREQPLPSDAIYIGRERRSMGLAGSRFANPFSLPPKASPEMRADVIERYRKWLWGEIRTGRITVNDLLALRGKDLLCWCAPRPCHGEVVERAVQWAAQRVAPAPAAVAQPPMAQQSIDVPQEERPQENRPQAAAQDPAAATLRISSSRIQEVIRQRQPPEWPGF